MKKNIYIFRSILFNLILFIWTILLGIIFIPVLFIPKKKLLIKVSKLWAKGICFFLKKICKIKIRFIGIENIPTGDFIVASKHQSALDIVLLIRYLKNPVFVMKSSLLYLPIIGNYGKKMGMIPVNRRGGASSLKKMIKDVILAIQDKKSVIIFPEGTRTAPRAKVKYHTGILAIYQAAKCPVLPVALNTGICWKRNSFIKLPGEVVIKFLPIIPNDVPKEIFMPKLQEEIEKESNLLLK